MMDKFLNWLLVSSADANKWSLTVRGATVCIPTIVVFGSLAHLQISSDILTTIIDGVSTFLLYFGGFLSGLVTVYGALRKIYLSITGQNEISKL